MTSQKVAGAPQPRLCLQLLEGGGAVARVVAAALGGRREERGDGDTGSATAPGYPLAWPGLLRSREAVQKSRQSPALKEN